MLPALFVSHGAPSLVLEDVPARAFLAGLFGRLPQRPRAILAVSAHWETARPALTAAPRQRAWHDFRGFPEALYRLDYAPPGDPALAEAIADRLAHHGLAADLDAGRPLDHGAWVPLLLAAPAAEIPVVQLSVQPRLGAGHHAEVGRALAPLRDDGVLILASGALTHDLGNLAIGSDAAPAYVTACADWLADAVTAGRGSDLLAWRRLAPDAVRNHPTDEHLLPLFVAMGAGGLPGRRLHQSVSHGTLRMDAFAFDAC